MRESCEDRLLLVNDFVINTSTGAQPKSHHEQYPSGFEWLLAPGILTHNQLWCLHRPNPKREKTKGSCRCVSFDVRDERMKNQQTTGSKRNVSGRNSVHVTGSQQPAVQQGVKLNA